MNPMGVIGRGHVDVVVLEVMVRGVGSNIL